MSTLPAEIHASPWSHALYGSSIASLFHQYRLRTCLKICRSLPGSAVLEIGCHDLLFYQLLNRRFERYAGIDREPYLASCASGRARLPGNVSVRQGVAEALPYEHEAFDLVLCFETIEHVTDEAKAVREIERVLAPGGRLVLSMPIEYGLLLPLKVLTRRLLRGTREYRLDELVEASVRCRPARIARDQHKGYDYRRTIEMLRSLGLEVEVQRRLPVHWLPGWMNLGAVVVFRKPLARSQRLGETSTDEIRIDVAHHGAGSDSAVDQTRGARRRDPRA
jgi:SAM-dependent methyltransferase